MSIQKYIVADWFQYSRAMVFDIKQTIHQYALGVQKNPGMTHTPAQEHALMVLANFMQNTHHDFLYRTYDPDKHELQVISEELIDLEAWLQLALDRVSSTSALDADAQKIIRKIQEGCFNRLNGTKVMIFEAMFENPGELHMVFGAMLARERGGVR